MSALSPCQERDSQLESAEGGVGSHHLGVKQLVLPEADHRDQRRTCTHQSTACCATLRHAWPYGRGCMPSVSFRWAQWTQQGS